MRYLTACMLFFVWLLLILSTSQSQSSSNKNNPPVEKQEWSFVGADDIQLIQFNTRTISVSPTGIVKVWIRVKDSSFGTLKSFREAEIKSRKKYNLSIEGYDKYAERMNLYEVDCDSNKLRQLISIDYDSQGKVLDTLDRSNTYLRWNEIIPETIGESIATTSCLHTFRQRIEKKHPGFFNKKQN